jgi:hypothetical protein
MDSLPEDIFVTSFQFTPRVFQDQYPAIDPRRPELSLAGKVVVITGASRGIGAKVETHVYPVRHELQGLPISLLGFRSCVHQGRCKRASSSGH